MKSSVIVFPGSNCDRDVAVALEKLQFKNSMVWHKETELPKSDLIVVPGGFSYGDYLRSGAIAAKSNILSEVVEAGKKGALILGICNGFQILIECGLLQGALLRNSGLKFISKDILVKVQSNKNKFFNKYKIGDVLKLNIAHNEGNYFTDEKHLEELEMAGNFISKKSLSKLTKSPLLSHLKKMDLRRNRLKDSDQLFITQSPEFGNIKSMRF